MTNVFMTNKSALSLIAKAEKIFTDFPHLPKSLTEFFVKITPWGVGLGAFFSAMGVITNLRLGLGMGSIGRAMNIYIGINPIYFLLTAVLQIILIVIAFKAFNLLRNRKIEGWIYLFWSNAISLVEYALTLIFLGGSAFSLLIGALIGYYLLFEMKPFYEVDKVKKTSKTKTKKN